MKIVLANPPVVYSDTANPENDFSFKEFVISPYLWRRWGGMNFCRFLHRVGFGNGVRYGIRAGSRWPFSMNTPFHEYAPYPFLMGYTAAVLLQQGYQVELMDAVASGENNYERFLQRIKNAHPDIVLLEVSAPTIDIDLWFAEKIATFAEVAVAGSHVVYNAFTLVEENPNIKYFLKGEYILSSLQMVQTRRGRVYESQVIKNLDSIPYPYRSYGEHIMYYDPSMPTLRPQLQIYAGKGCPFQCTYCLWPQTMYGKHVALRSPEKVADEIRTCIKDCAYRSIFFDDDTFNLGGDDRISVLCDHLKQIGLPWTMMGRLDCSPLWLFDKMIDSGCVGMRFGIETFDNEVSRIIKKGLKVEDVQNVLGYLCETYPKLMLHVTMMKNLPGQSRNAHERDMAILKNMGFSKSDRYRSYQLSSCVPFPGTALYNDLLKKYGTAYQNDSKLYDGFTEGFADILENLYD